MIDEATLYDVLDTVSHLVATAFVFIWITRHNLPKWKVFVGNIAYIVAVLAAIVRMVLLILA